VFHFDTSFVEDFQNVKYQRDYNLGLPTGRHIQIWPTSVQTGSNFISMSLQYGI